jgi:hypothetical protein
MKGNNKLHLNEATLIDIVQQWVDRIMTEHSKVVSVKFVDYMGDDDTFEITLAEPPTA